MYPEGEIRIGERRIRKLKPREISQVQVFWRKQHQVVITWEDEDLFRREYLELFTEGAEDQT